MTEIDRVVGLVGFIVFVGFWLGMAYLMLVNPRTWIEWFVAKPWRPFGLMVSVQDEQKLRRRSRFVGSIYFIIGILMLVLVAPVMMFGQPISPK